MKCPLGLYITAELGLACRDAASLLLQVGVDEGIYVTGQVVFGIACLKARAMVLDDIVRMDGDSANLRAEVGLHILALEARRLFLALLLF